MADTHHTHHAQHGQHGQHGEHAEHVHHADCRRLRRALRDARGSLEPPQRDTTFPGAQSAIVVDPRDLTPDASPELQEDIRTLEQALRDLGCDPDGDWDDSDAGDEDGEAIPRSQYLDSETLTEEEQEQRETLLSQMAESRERLDSDGVDMPGEERTVGEPVEQELARMRGDEGAQRDA